MAERLSSELATRTTWDDGREKSATALIDSISLPPSWSSPPAGLAVAAGPSFGRGGLAPEAERQLVAMEDVLLAVGVGADRLDDLRLVDARGDDRAGRLDA